MDGYFVSDVIKLFQNQLPDDPLAKELVGFLKFDSGQKWNVNDRTRILNLVSECLVRKSTTTIMAGYFSPILLDLLHRVLKRHSRISLFRLLSKLIGQFGCATNFAYECFSDRLFVSTDLINSIKHEHEHKTEENLIEFLESCYLFLKFDSEFFVNNFDWTFIVEFISQFSAKHRYLSLKIYSLIFKQNPQFFGETIVQELPSLDYRLELFQSSNDKHLKCLSTTIRYVEGQSAETRLICDDDFGDELVCVKGILLPKIGNSKPENTKTADSIRLSTFGQNLKSIALGVSLRKPILVEGPMSCGKSTLINQLARLTGRKGPPQIMTIQISDQVDTKYLLGSYVCSEIPGEFLFNFGPLLKAIKEGHWIVLEDIDSASPDLISSIVSIVESRNSANIAGYEDKIEKFSRDFRIFFTRNVHTSGSSMLPNVNYKMLKKICYTINMANIDQSNVEQILSNSWPEMNLMIPRILSIYENLQTLFQPKFKRHVWLRDLIKWCNRLGGYFQLNSDEASKFAFLDAVDCFAGFCTEKSMVEDVSEMIGSHFNLSKSECKHLLEERNPNQIRTRKDSVVTVVVGRQTFQAGESSTRNLIDFAFTLNTSQLLERLLVCVSHQEPVLLCGETGVGKTSSVQYLANLCGKRLNIVNMNQQSNSTELFGGYKPIDLKFLINAVKEDYLQLFDQTFSAEKNDTFKNKLATLYRQQNYKVLLDAMMHVCKEALKKSKKNQPELLNDWNQLLEKLGKFKQLVSNKNPLTFSFIEGILTNAIKSGEWVLLDEINLAENETLQSLLSFMENDQMLMLFEKSQDQMVKVHKDFRLFACMNPATDVGKKELPMKIRSRFTEFFISEVSDRSQLRIIVSSYVENLVDQPTIERIVTFHLKIKMDSQTILKDINGHRPVFSLRNLCRALRVTKHNPFKSIQRSLYEAFALAFLSNLDQSSYEIVQDLIQKLIFPNTKLSALFQMRLEKMFPEASHVIIENYPIVKGAEEPIRDSNYILTPMVTKNLGDICRIISAGQAFPILLQGETSVGKTSLIQWLAKATGNVCHRVNNHEQTDLQEYVGSYCTESDGRIVFKKGILVEAMIHGHWIILDELNLASTEILEALNRVLDDNREIFIPETQEIIKAHPRFLVFATQNPPGRYGGRKILSRAFRNRFIELNFNEIPLPELEEILHRKCAIPLSYSKRMCSVLIQLRTHRCKSDIFAGKSGFITLRDLFRWGYRYMKFAANLDANIKFFDWNEYLAQQGFMLLAGRVRNDDDVLLIKNILEKTFKCTISLDQLFFHRSFPMEGLEKFSNLVWTNTFKRLGRLIQEAIEYQEPILLIGETGCGKTTICQYFAAIQGKALKIINCHSNMESGDFIGSLRPNRNHESDPNESKLFEWVDGPLITAMKNGDYFLVDEISLADDSVLERLNSVLESERTIFLAENSENSLIHAHPSFCYFATMNPGGDYGKKELSPALRDRFTEIWCPVFQDFDDDIKKIVHHNIPECLTTIRNALTESICVFLKWYRNFISKYKRFIISIRDVLSWIQFIRQTFFNQHCLTLSEAFIHGALSVFLDSMGHSDLAIINRLTNSKDVRKIIAEQIKSISKQLEPVTTDCTLVKYSGRDEFFTIGRFFIKKNLCRPCKNVTEYHWDSSGIRSNSIRIMRALQLDKPILLEGPPGVGKTSLIQALAEATGHCLIRINLSDQTDISDLFGCDLPMEGDGTAGKFRFRDGPLLTAMKSDQPTWILLDELNLASQTVLEGLNACFDHRGEIYISELNKTFMVNRNRTRIFATQNPLSMDGTRKGLPKSFLNRFTAVYVDRLKDVDYRKILFNLFPKIPVDLVCKMVDANRKICDHINQDHSFAKNGGPFEFNLRDLVRWAQLTVKWEAKNPGQIVPEMFFDLIYANKMRTMDDRQKMKRIGMEVFGYQKNDDDQTVCFIHANINQFGSSIFQRLKHLHLDDQKMSYVFRQHKTIIESILTCIEMNWLTILISLESGVGKSHLIKLIADICGHDLLVLHVNPEMDTIDLLGGFEQKDLQVDLKHLEETIVGFGFRQLLNTSSLGDLCLVRKFLSNYYQLKQSVGHGTPAQYFRSKIEILRKILDVFQSHPQRISSMMEMLAKLEKNIHLLNNNGTFEWRDSSLVKSIQNGQWVVIENANFLNPAVLDRLNSVLEPNGTLTINEKGSIDGQIVCIRPHPDFRLFLTMNCQHGELSRAMRNRGIEIVVPAEVNPNELINVARKHGVPVTEDYWPNYAAFFETITEKILKNQHNFDHLDDDDAQHDHEDHDDSMVVQAKSEDRISSIISLPTNLNHFASDPDLYNVCRDFHHLDLKANIDDHTRIRLFLENSSFNDYRIRFDLLESVDGYRFQFDRENMEKELQKLFGENGGPFDSNENLPIEVRENPYLFDYVRNQTGPRRSMVLWNVHLNRFHLNLLWREFRTKSIPFENEESMLNFASDDLKKVQAKHRSGLILIIKFVSALFSEVDAHIDRLPPIEDQNLVSSRSWLEMVAQFLFLCSHKPKHEDWIQFMTQSIFPYWFIMDETQHLTFTKRLKKGAQLINHRFGPAMFDRVKITLIYRMTTNLFRSWSGQDLEIYLKFKEFIKCSRNYVRRHELDDDDDDDDTFRKLCDLAQSYSQSIVAYFNGKNSADLSGEIRAEILAKHRYLKHCCKVASNRIPADPKRYVLSKLFQSVRLLDKFLGNDETSANLQFGHSDPNFILLSELLKNGPYTDLLMEILSDINQELSIASIIERIGGGGDHVPESSVIVQNLDAKLLQNVTGECWPLISMIYFDLVDKEQDSIQRFHRKQSDKDFYSKLLMKNYGDLKRKRHVCSDRFEIMARKFSNRISVNQSKIHSLMETVLPAEVRIQNRNYVIEEMVQNFSITLMGFQMAFATAPDFLVDPAIRNATRLKLVEFRSGFIRNELDLRHKFYDRIYGHHDENFVGNVFKLLKMDLARNDYMVEQIKPNIGYRRSENGYDLLRNQVLHFRWTIFDWHNVRDVLLKIRHFMLDDDDDNNGDISSQDAIPTCLNFLHSIMDFHRKLMYGKDFEDFHDITVPYIIGTLFVAKGLQLCIYRMQSRSNSARILQPFSSNTFQRLLERFAQFFSVDAPSEICKFIFHNDIIRILLGIFKRLKINEQHLVRNLLRSIFLEIRNSLFLGQDQPEVVGLYFETIDAFVAQWKAIETNEESETLRKNALFHIQLKDPEQDSLEEIFPSFDHHYQGLIEEDFDAAPMKKDDTIRTDTLTKETLLFMARTHVDMIGLLEEQDDDDDHRIEISRLDFLEPYSIRYGIVGEIFEKTLGFIECNIEQELIDGHLLIIHSGSKRKEEANYGQKKINIYHASITEQIGKCCQVLERLRTKIQDKLLPEFENHPVLMKLLEIIQRIYSIKAHCSLLCVATGLELVLKTSEDWQLIAHRGISLVEHLNEVTELLISWRKMEINYWQHCLDTVTDRIDEQQLITWWFRFYTTINDHLLDPEPDSEQIKQFINNVKKFMEDSTMGQYRIRLKIIKVFLSYLKHSKTETTNGSISVALENIFNFYNQFNPAVMESIDSEKNSIRKEIRQFVKISKWNPNNFWSLKTSLMRSKKQLYDFVKKFEQSLSKPASVVFRFQDERSIEPFGWLNRNCFGELKKPNQLEDFLDEYSDCPTEFVSKAPIYYRKCGQLLRKIGGSIGKSILEKIHHSEQLNRMLIEGIQEYSKLNVTETKDAQARKKMIGQCQNRKRRALTEMFQKLSHLGLSYRKGLVNFEVFKMDETIYTIKPFQVEEMCAEKEMIRSCQTYYYKCLSGYSKFVSGLEKPNDQLSLDIVDRIKGFVVHLAMIVVEQQTLVSEKFHEFNALKQRFGQIQNSLGDHGVEPKLLDYADANSVQDECRELMFQFISSVVRFKELVSCLSTDHVAELDQIITHSEHILRQFFDRSDKFIFYTESGLSKMKTCNEQLKYQIERLLTLFDGSAELSELFREKFIHFHKKNNEILDEIVRLSSQSYPDDTNDSVEFDKIFTQKFDQSMKYILLSAEKVFKKLAISRNESLGSEVFDDKNLIHVHCSFIEVLNLLNPQRVLDSIDDLIEQMNKNYHQKMSGSYLRMIRILMPFYAKYTDLFQCVLRVSFGSLRTSSKLLHILMTLANELLTKGFCLPPDLPPETDGQQQNEKNIENAGFGDGSVAPDSKDVSDRLECQDQLDDLDQGGQAANEDQTANDDGQKLENNENGIEMDDDFDGQEYGADQRKDDEGDDDDDDETEEDGKDEEDLAEKMGKVDDNEQVLDEKLWANESGSESEEEEDDDDDDEKNNDKDEDIAGGKEDLDSRTVAKQDDENKKTGDQTAANDETLPAEDYGGDDDDEDDDDDAPEPDVDHPMKDEDENPYRKDEAEMVLPDNLQLDLNENETEPEMERESEMESENVEEEEVQEGKDIEDVEMEDGIGEEDDQTQSADDVSNSQKEEDQQPQQGEEAMNDAQNSVQNLDRKDSSNQFGQTGQSNDDCLKDEDDNSGDHSTQMTQSSGTNKRDRISRVRSEDEIRNDRENDNTMTRNRKNRLVAEDESKAKRQKLISSDAPEEPFDQDQSKQPESELFKHVQDKSRAQDLAYDIAKDQDQCNPLDEHLERGVEINRNDEQMDSIEDQDDKRPSVNANPSDETKLEDGDNEDGTNKNDGEKQIQGDIVLTHTVKNKESYFHTNHQDQMMPATAKQEDMEQEDPLNDSMDTGQDPSDLNYDLLKESEKRIEPLIYELCNQLQLVLEPTKRAKYKGDFKNGKRLNMRKVIPYVASQFRKDKIWLRRNKPSKRQYQIIIAVDDSLSMSDNQSRMIAFDSLILLGKSLSIIESGMLSVISFGEQCKIVHPFGEPFTDQTALKMFNKFQFDQKNTKINELLGCSLRMFSVAKHQQQQHSNDNSAVVHQLLLIVSDGRGIFSEGEQNIQLSIMRLKEMGIFSVFIIVDNPDHRNSILDIRTPVFDPNSGQVKLQSYIEKFPFPYYLILKDIVSLPSILGEALRQWFELIAT